MKKIKCIILPLFMFVLFIINGCEISIFTDSNPTEFFIDNSTSWEPDLKGIRGGDIVYISSRDSNVLHIKGIEGEPGNPIVFINDGDTAVIKAIRFEDCRYIRLTGTGGNDTYGIRFIDSQWKCGIYVVGESSDFEIDHCEISAIDGVAISVKEDYGGDPPIPYPMFSNLSIHDCRIDNIGHSVGIYIGETKSPGMEFSHVRIYNNIITNTGRESIQIANCIEDTEIYGNLCYNAGTTKLYAQGNNLQLGDNCGDIKVYNNVLVKAFEYGIISFANGGVEFFNNYISENHGMYLADRKMSPSLEPIVIRNNYIYGFDNEGHGDNQHIDVCINTCKVVIKDNKHSANLYSQYNTAEVETDGNVTNVVNVSFDGTVDDLRMWQFILNR